MVFIVSSSVIPYNDDYMFGDLSTFWFIMLVLRFVVCVMFFIINPNVVSILSGSDDLCLVSSCAFGVATGSLGWFARDGWSYRCIKH